MHVLIRLQLYFNLIQLNLKPFYGIATLPSTDQPPCSALLAFQLTSTTVNGLVNGMWVLRASSFHAETFAVYAPG